MKCLFTNKEYNKVDLDRLEGRAEVAASQETMKPFLFNLKKIADYHPLLGTSDIVSDKTEGVGAKRKLTYADGSGTKFFETVVEVNGVDSIRLQLSEHPFPCEILYAHLSTERVDDDNCIFKVAAEYKLNDGIKPEAFEPGTLWLFQAIADGGAKDIADNY